MEEAVKGKGMRGGVEYDCDIHAGRKCIGSTSDVFTDYVRLANFTWHGS